MFKTYYEDLLLFKDDKDFVNYAFAKREKRKMTLWGKAIGRHLQENYNQWKVDVTKERDTQKDEFVIRVFGELLQMGIAYAASRGQETPLTTKLRSSFDNLIK